MIFRNSVYLPVYRVAWILVVAYLQSKSKMSQNPQKSSKLGQFSSTTHTHHWHTLTSHHWHTLTSHHWHTLTSHHSHTLTSHHSPVTTDTHPQLNWHTHHSITPPPLFLLHSLLLLPPPLPLPLSGWQTTEVDEGDVWSPECWLVGGGPTEDCCQGRPTHCRPRPYITGGPWNFETCFWHALPPSLSLSLPPPLSFNLSLPFTLVSIYSVFPSLPPSRVLLVLMIHSTIWWLWPQRNCTLLSQNNSAPIIICHATRALARNIFRWCNVFVCSQQNKIRPFPAKLFSIVQMGAGNSSQPPNTYNNDINHQLQQLTECWIPTMRWTCWRRSSPHKTSPMSLVWSSNYLHTKLKPFILPCVNRSLLHMRMRFTYYF